MVHPRASNREYKGKIETVDERERKRKEEKKRIRKGSEKREK